MHTQFVRCIAGNIVGIIWNCLQEDMRPYYCSVMWVELLEPWMKCSYPEIRLQCKFVLGQMHAAYAIIPDDSSCLELDEKDMKLQFSLLNAAITSHNVMTIQQFEWEFSASELIVGFQCISLNPNNLSMMLHLGIVSLMSECLQKSDSVVKAEVCKLLWSLIDSSASYNIKFSLDLDLIKDLEADEDSNLKILSTSLRLASSLISNSNFDTKIGKSLVIAEEEGLLCSPLAALDSVIYISIVAYIHTYNTVLPRLS